MLPIVESTGHGLGWDVEDVTLDGVPTRAVGHDGRLLGGVVTTLPTFSDREMAVAVVANIAYADTRGLAVQIADLFARTNQ